MSPASLDHPAARRLRLAFDLYAAGEAMMRQNLRRRYPRSDPAQIERKLVEWLLERPGAELGDTDGRPAVWPRTS